MPARNPPDPNAKPLIERFQEMARKLGCDEDEGAFRGSTLKPSKFLISSSWTERDALPIPTFPKRPIFGNVAEP